MVKVWIGDQGSVGECNCESLLAHWERYSGVRLSMFCYAMACPCTPAVGAMVRAGDTDDEPWYVVPLCMEHAAKTGEAIELLPEVQLVLAKARWTCRRGAYRQQSDSLIGIESDSR